jgi:hypothetical protein
VCSYFLGQLSANGSSSRRRSGLFNSTRLFVVLRLEIVDCGPGKRGKFDFHHIQLRFDTEIARPPPTTTTSTFPSSPTGCLPASRYFACATAILPIAFNCPSLWTFFRQNSSDKTCIVSITNFHEHDAPTSFPGSSLGARSLSWVCATSRRVQGRGKKECGRLLKHPRRCSAVARRER